MPEQDDKIEQIANDGVTKYVEKTFLKKILYFFKSKGININTILLICIIITLVWFGRPIYDRFNDLPNKVENTIKKDRTQDSVILIIPTKMDRMNKVYNERLKNIHDNFLLLIDYRNADKKLLKELINKSYQIKETKTVSPTHNFDVETLLEDSIKSIKRNDTCK